MDAISNLIIEYPIESLIIFFVSPAILVALLLAPFPPIDIFTPFEEAITRFFTEKGRGGRGNLSSRVGRQNREEGTDEFGNSTYHDYQ